MKMNKATVDGSVGCRFLLRTPLEGAFFFASLFHLLSEEGGGGLG